jgi:hypothetical protein
VSASELASTWRAPVLPNVLASNLMKPLAVIGLASRRARSLDGVPLLRAGSPLLGDVLVLADGVFPSSYARLEASSYVLADVLALTTVQCRSVTHGQC